MIRLESNVKPYFSKESCNRNRPFSSVSALTKAYINTFASFWSKLEIKYTPTKPVLPVTNSVWLPVASSCASPRYLVQSSKSVSSSVWPLFPDTALTNPSTVGSEINAWKSTSQFQPLSTSYSSLEIKRELPPKSKKLSKIPIFLTSRRSSQIFSIFLWSSDKFTSLLRISLCARIKSAPQASVIKCFCSSEIRYVSISFLFTFSHFFSSTARFSSADASVPNTLNFGLYSSVISLLRTTESRSTPTRALCWT